MTGVPPSGSGCQPSASAADASSQSGIPNARRFPILTGGGPRDPKRYVPWAVAERARAQAYRNHGQTLERLAERGGLSIVELAGALTGLRWGRLGGITKGEAERIVASAIEAAAAGETGTGSTEGESAVRDSGDARPSAPSPTSQQEGQ